MRPLFHTISTLQGVQIDYFVAYLILTLILVSLIGIPFWIIEKLGVVLLSVIPLGVGRVFGAIFSALLNIGQLIVSIIIIIYGIQRAIEAATLKKAVNFGFTIHDDEVKAEPIKAQPKPVVEPQTSFQASAAPQPNPQVIVTDRSEPKKEKVIMPFIGNFFMLLFKGFVIICMIPGFMIAFGLVIALGVLLALACIDFCGVPDENVPILETIYLCGDPTLFHTTIVNRAHIAKG